MKRDLCTRAGAEALAERLRSYWAQRGICIRVWLEECEPNSKISNRPSFAVRSDLSVTTKASG